MQEAYEPYFILVDSPDDGERRFPLPPGETLIGRSPETDIRLLDTTVSRRHCRLERNGTEVRIYDSGSHNSTWVGTSPVGGQVLEDGDVVRLGRSKLVYHTRTPSRGPAAEPPAPGRGEKPGDRARPDSRLASKPRRQERRFTPGAIEPRARKRLARRRVPLGELGVLFVVIVLLSALGAWIISSKGRGGISGPSSGALSGSEIGRAHV